MKRIFLSILFIALLASCKQECPECKKCPEQDVNTIDKESEITTKELKAKLNKEGFQTFDYVDEKTKDTVIMQQYFIAFLKKGPNRSQSKEEASQLQKEHLAHLGKMYELGYADISGPFGDDGDIRGITIYNTPTLKTADSLANADPMVKAGRLVIEIHPWWAAKGFPLR
ncbi:YciI family protein [Pseudofulvibacter geojedonensis]|uniref:YciI family protein n=1 Tax=Pseudofulvibacter geojedonensis TaxID=1123758 RepID=A0ABW3I6A8_9FLAO